MSNLRPQGVSLFRASIRPNEHLIYVEFQSGVHLVPLFNPFINAQYTPSLPPQNIRKPDGFLIFSGGRERVHWE